MQNRSTDRDYTSHRPSYRVSAPESKISHAELLEELKKARDLRRKRRTRRFIIFFIILLIISFGGWQGFRRQFQQQNIHRLPESVLKNVNFPVYYPSRLLANYAPDNSVELSHDIFVYKFGDKHGKQLTVTSQVVPAGFSAKTYFYQQEPKVIDLPIGKLYDISTSQQSRYMVITTDGVLIFISANSKIDHQIIQSFVSSFKLIDK